MPGHVRGDVRKAQHDHDGAPCWSRECAPTHHIHPDAGVRELIAREVAAAEKRGAERVAQTVERLAGEMSAAVYLTLTSLLAEHRDEHPAPECECAMTESSQRRCPRHGEDQYRDPAPEPSSDVTEDELVRVMTTYVNRAGNARRILAAFHVTPRAEA